MLLFYGLVDQAESTYNKQIIWQIFAVVDAAVHADESLHAGLVLYTGVVQAGVEHNDGKRQHVTGVCGGNRGDYYWPFVWGIHQTGHSTMGNWGLGTGSQTI